MDSTPVAYTVEPNNVKRRSYFTVVIYTVESNNVSSTYVIYMCQSVTVPRGMMGMVPFLHV